MRVTRLLTAAAVAGAAFAVPSGTASAHPVDVMLSTTGSCPSGYIEVAQTSLTAYCVHVMVPGAHLATNGQPCASGYREYSVLNTYRVCVRLDH